MPPSRDPGVPLETTNEEILTGSGIPCTSMTWTTSQAAHSEHRDGFVQASGATLRITPSRHVDLCQRIRADRPDSLAQTAARATQPAQQINGSSAASTVGCSRRAYRMPAQRSWSPTPPFPRDAIRKVRGEGIVVRATTCRCARVFASLWDAPRWGSRWHLASHSGFRRGEPVLTSRLVGWVR
jgi:hypothetical protein